MKILDLFAEGTTKLPSSENPSCTHSFRWPDSGSAIASFLKPKECPSSGSKAICAQAVHCANWEKLGRSCQKSATLRRKRKFRVRFFCDGDVSGRVEVEISLLLLKPICV